MGKIGLGIGIAKKGWGLLGKALSKSKSKTSSTLNSVKGKYNIGNASKVKNKAAQSKMETSAFDAKQSSKKFKESVDKVFK